MIIPLPTMDFDFCFPSWRSLNVSVLEAIEVYSCYNFIPRTGLLQKLLYICSGDNLPEMQETWV